MRIKVIRTLALLPVLFLFCLASGCSTQAFPTGINGVAILQAGGGNVFPPPPITHDPLAGAILTVQPNGGGGEITRQVADSHGGFRIELPAGTYTLIPEPPPDQRLVLAPEPQTIVVLPNRLTQVVITYSSVSHF